MHSELLLVAGVLNQICFSQADKGDFKLKDGPFVMTEEEAAKYKKETEQYEAEKKAGDPSDLFATNQHLSYPDKYHDFSRRFVLQYPYKEKSHLIEDEEAEANLDNVITNFREEMLANSRLKPVKAPPELVLAVAKQSALLEASKPINPSEYLIQKDILRSGDYWDSVWQEDVDPKSILRSQKDNNIVQSVNVKIMPGSKLYQLVSVLKKISPRLIYVINKD